jgi:hypothetical protein
MNADKSLLKNIRNAFIAAGLISTIPVVMGLFGLFFMREMEQIIGMILAFIIWWIFYMLYYDMIPRALKERNWLTSFGAILRFTIGFVVVFTMGS